VAKNRAANDSFADRQNTATSTMSDGNIDGGEYSSDKAIAAILLCSIEILLKKVCAKLIRHYR
jgi:hypothetical protein